MDQIQNILSGPWNNNSACKITDLRRQLTELWNQEETYWAQKSRIQWLKCGDKNSKFFRMTTIQRRCRNRITRLRLTDDSWIEDEDQIGNNFAQFYSDLFKSTEGRNFTHILEGIDTLISDEDNSFLMRVISNEEIKSAVFELGDTKAPGPDGFTGAFYQKAWPTIGGQVCSLIKEFFDTGFPLEEINQTDMVFIPKKDCPETMSDYRPISLRNFS